MANMDMPEFQWRVVPPEVTEETLLRASLGLLSPEELAHLEQQLRSAPLADPSDLEDDFGTCCRD